MSLAEVINLADYRAHKRGADARLTHREVRELVDAAVEAELARMLPDAIEVATRPLRAAPAATARRPGVAAESAADIAIAQIERRRQRSELAVMAWRLVTMLAELGAVDPFQRAALQKLRDTLDEIARLTRLGCALRGESEADVVRRVLLQTGRVKGRSTVGRVRQPDGLAPEATKNVKATNGRRAQRKVAKFAEIAEQWEGEWAGVEIAEQWEGEWAGVLRALETVDAAFADID